jgi:hypothetical protein
MKLFISVIFCYILLGCNGINNNSSYFNITIEGQNFYWEGNSTTSLDGKSIYLSSSTSTCGGKNAIQMWEGDLSFPSFYCSFFIPDGEGTFVIADSIGCSAMIIQGPWPYALISGIETNNGSIAQPIVNITHSGYNKIKGTISGNIAESNQDGTYTSRPISGSFKLKKI